MLVAVRDEVRRDARVQAGDVGQQMLRCGVQLHADVVHAAHDHVVERALEGALIHVVLILAHADGLRIELHQLGERVHEPPPDRHRAAHGDVLVGELLTGHIARGINGRAAFADHDHGDRRGQAELADESLRLARSGAVADGDGLDFELRHHRLDHRLRLGQIARAFLGIDHIVREELSLAVEEHDFAAGAKAGVDAERDLLPERRGQQQLAQVVGENADRLLVRALCEKGPRLAFHRETEQPLEAILHREPHLLGRGRFAFDEEPLQRAHRLDFIGHEARKQEALRLAAPNREDAVRRRFLRRLAPVEVVLELRPLLLLPADDLRFDHAFRKVKIPQLRARRGVVIDPLREDVARSRQRGGDIGDAVFFRVDLDLRPDKRHRRRRRIGRDVLRPEQVGERLQPEIARHRRLRFFLRAERQVDVLQRGHRLRRVDLCAQRFRHQFPLHERRHHGLAPLVEFLELLQPVANGHDLHLVEFTRLLLPIPRDEGHRRPSFQKHRRGGDLTRLELEFGDEFDEVLFDHGAEKGAHDERSTRRVKRDCASALHFPPRLGLEVDLLLFHLEAAGLQQIGHAFRAAHRLL